MQPFSFSWCSCVQNHCSLGAMTEVWDLLTSPNCRHHSLGLNTRTQQCQCLLWYLSENSWAACSQAAPPGARGHIWIPHTGRAGWAVPVASWPGAQAGGSPSTRSLYLPPHIWGDTQCPWDGQDPAPKLLSQKPVWQHHEVYGRNQPKVFPSMDYSQFSCYSPSCCNLSPKNTCALFVLERLFVLASADWKYPVSN